MESGGVGQGEEEDSEEELRCSYQLNHSLQALEKNTTDTIRYLLVGVHALTLFEYQATK